MTEPSPAELRPKLVGARVQRVEDPRLLAGRGAYVDDHRLPGMLHVAFVRADRPHARIISIDGAAAAALPGVTAVFTADDISALYHTIRATSRMKDYHATELCPLARGTVRYVGEPVAAIVAENRYIAEDAAQQVLVDYRDLETYNRP